jgi:hypothetical protein
MQISGPMLLGQPLEMTSTNRKIAHLGDPAQG